MKLSTKKFGSIATAAVLAGTMAFMPATALAASVSTTDQGADTKITKTWEVPSDAQYSDDEEFTFALTYSTADEINGIKSAHPTTADGADFTSSNIVMKGKDFTANGTNYTASKTLADALSGINFSKPGQYYFTLTEIPGNDQDIVYNPTNASYMVRVDVVWDLDAEGAPTTTAKIKTVQLLNAAGKVKAPVAAFTNTDPNGNLKVEKTVKGIAANTNDEFTFSVTLTKGGKPLAGSYNTKKNGTASDKVHDGSTFTLKSGETFEIDNLPEGTSYTVTETDAKGYDSTDVTAEGTTTQKTTTGSGTISNGDNDKVDFVNNKGFGPQTGITMNTLPFVAVGVVAVAGGAALVISRRRHAGEDF